MSKKSTWLVSGDLNGDGFDEILCHEIINDQVYVTVFAISGELEPISLPYTWDWGMTCHYLDLDLMSEGYQQVVTVRAGETVNAEIKFQRWSGAGNPSEINQVFLLYSWSSSWNPPSNYTPLWDGISGTYPGITKTVKFSFTVPEEPGTYYIWIRADAMYSMEDALANIWNKYQGPPPYNDAGGGIIGKIIVSKPFNSWADEDGDRIPNYLDLLKFDVTELVGDTSIPLRVGPIKVGEISWPVTIYVVQPATSLSNMLFELGKWGVVYDEEATYLMAIPIILDVRSVDSLLNWLSPFIPDVLENVVRSQLCSDGHLRLLILLAVKYLPPGFDDVVSLLKTVKELMLGTVNVIEVVNELLEVFLPVVDMAIYSIKEGLNSAVNAIYVISLQDIVRALTHLISLALDFLQIVLEVVSAIVAGILTAGATIAALALKSFNFIVDYILDYLPIPEGIQQLLHHVKVVLNLVDPPGTELELQLCNSSTGSLILGYDVENKLNYTYSDIGFWFEDPDKQILLLSKNVTQYNITITCWSSTNGLKVEPNNLTYSLIICDSTFNYTKISGGFLAPGEKTSTLVEIGPNNETNLSNYLVASASFSNVGPERGETVQVNVTLTDELSNPIVNGEVLLLVGDRWISAENIGGGIYIASINTEQFAWLNLVYVYGRKSGYLDVMAVYSLNVTDTTPPTLTTSLVESSFLRGSVTIVVDVNDISKITYVEFRVNGSQVYVDYDTLYEFEWNTATYSDGLYFVELVAVDEFGNTANKTVSVVVDNTAPTIETLVVEPEEPVEGEEVVVSVVISDEISGVENATLWYRVTGGDWEPLQMSLEAGKWKATIPGQEAGAGVEYYVKAYDKAGNFAKSGTYSYSVVSKPPELLRPGLIAIIVMILLAALLLVAKRRKKAHVAPAVAERKPEARILKVCPYCGAPITVEARFCPHCGAYLEE